MNRNLTEKLKYKISFKFFDAYCNLMESYDNAMACLKAWDERTYEIFYEWYVEDGIGYYEDIVTNILKEKLDDRFMVFMDIYKSYLEDAIEENSKQVLMDFLYMIPKRMKEDFLKFGFLEDRQEFIWNYHIPMDLDFVYECNLEPDRYCQVSLF